MGEWENSEKYGANTLPQIKKEKINSSDGAT